MKKLPILASVCALIVASAVSGQQYTIEDMGTLSATPTDGVRAAGINNRGHVHGESDRTPPGGIGIQQRSFLWQGGQLSHIQPPSAGSTWSGDLNDSDVCVGNFTFSSSEFRGYSWQANVLSSFVVGNHKFTKTTGINHDGYMTGTFVSDTVVGMVFRNHAFARNPAGAWFDIGTLGGMDSYGHAINDRNIVVGSARDASDSFQGFMWSLNGGLVALDHLGGAYTRASDINNFNTIVGFSRDQNTNTLPCFWSAGTITALPTLGGLAGEVKSINDFGAMVGNAANPSGQQLACLWNAGVVNDLNASIAPGSGWLLTGAKDINELGEIAGTGQLNGIQRTFKLTPILTESRISGFQPGFAGRVNQMFGMGFTPGSTVQVYGGRFAGSSVTPCGAVVGIANAVLVATTTADQDGRIELSLALPPRVAGVAALLQTVEPSGCLVGELRSQQLQ
jgi:hypothetical protein